MLKVKLLTKILGRKQRERERFSLVPKCKGRSQANFKGKDIPQVRDHH